MKNYNLPLDERLELGLKIVFILQNLIKVT
jgi:hypothetical protein